MPSAFTIGSFFIIVSLLLNSRIKKLEIKNSKFNYLLPIAALLILISSLKAFYSNIPELANFDKKNFLLGIFNWAPLFVIYFSVQSFLDDVNKKKETIAALIYGTLPILVSLILPSFFKSTGPFVSPFNLVTWYNRYNSNSSAGIFSNANYAGSWLLIIWPFCLYFLLEKTKNYKKTFFYLIITITTFISSLLTNSRNAFLCIFISTVIIMKKSIKYFLGIFFITISSIFIIKFFYNFETLNSIYDYINSKANIDQPTFFKLIKRIIDTYDLENLSDSPRYSVFKESIKLISERPFFGWGKGTFFTLYEIRNNENIYKIQHTHNLFLDLTYNYGFFVSGAITIFISNLVINAYKKLIKIPFHLNRFDYAWYSSIFTLIIFHLNDITYFDGRISILFWILLAGTNTFINDQKN